MKRLLVVLTVVIAGCGITPEQSRVMNEQMQSAYPWLNMGAQGAQKIPANSTTCTQVGPNLICR